MSNDTTIADSPGLRLIADERARQLDEWSPDHDDEHDCGELAVRAAELAVSHTDETVSVGAHCADGWGLVRKHGHDPVRSLTIAGALICAELDRILRERARLGGGCTPPKFAWGLNEEVFGPADFDTRTDALAAGRAEHPGEVIYTAQSEQVRVPAPFDSDEVAERVADLIFEQIGEGVELWELDDEAARSWDEFARDWAARLDVSQVFRAVFIEEHDPEADGPRRSKP